MDQLALQLEEQREKFVDGDGYLSEPLTATLVQRPINSVGNV